jgi:capsular polysaccharide biosynthesis protein
MLRRRWWLIVLPLVVAVVLTLPQFLNNGSAVSGGFYTVFRYSAAQQASNLPNRDGDYQDVWLASEFVVNAFTDWVRSGTFRAEMQTMLPDTINLTGLQIRADNDRSIGQVELEHPDGEQLAQIATAALDVLETRSQSYFPHLGDMPAQVTIIDAPMIVPQSPPLTNRFGPIIQWGIALLGGLTLAVVVEYLDPTLRHSDELQAMGMRVLSKIPRY